MDIELWDDMRGLERRFDDLFRTFMGPRSRTWFLPLSTSLHRVVVPAADVFVRKDDLVISLELPGIDPAKDVTITVEDGELVVRGERKELEEIKQQGYYRKETFHGTFERRFAVPEGTDEKKVKAEYKNGVLEIVLPAMAKPVQVPKAKAIPIKTVGKAAA
jgi:HSP20 family protein